MMVEKIQHECLHLNCGHKWKGIKDPKACPRCKRYDWNVDKEKGDSE